MFAVKHYIYVNTPSRLFSVKHFNQEKPAIADLADGFKKLTIENVSRKTFFER